MSNIKIFRANRGEGKTKWLVEQAMNEYDAGKTCYYFGHRDNFESIWESIRHEKCPIECRQHFDGMPPIQVRGIKEPCFFVDELLLNPAISYIRQYSIMNPHAVFYITMDQADFVN